MKSASGYFIGVESLPNIGLYILCATAKNIVIIKKRGLQMKRGLWFSRKPIEKHETAAWSDIESTKSVSNVAEPSNLQAENAKDYVDENEK